MLCGMSTLILLLIIIAIRDAWEKVFSKKANTDFGKGVRKFIEMFPERQRTDSFDFSDVHKLVLNIYPHSSSRECY